MGTSENELEKLASNGTLTLKRVKTEVVENGLEQLVANGTLTLKDFAYISDAVQKGKNILIAGVTGGGKTTLLESVASIIPVDKTVAVLHGKGGLRIKRENVLYYEQKEEDFGILILFLLVQERPQYLVLDDLRGNSAFELSRGVEIRKKSILTTIYANNHLDALNRLAKQAIEQNNFPLSELDIKTSIGDGVDLVILVEKTQSGRRKVTLQEVVQYNQKTAQFELQDCK